MFSSGPLVRTVGFPAMMYIIALVNFAYAPLMFFLRKLPDTLPEKPTDVNGAAAQQQTQITSQNVRLQARKQFMFVFRELSLWRSHTQLATRRSPE